MLSSADTEIPFWGRRPAVTVGRNGSHWTHTTVGQAAQGKTIISAIQESWDRRLDKIMQLSETQLLVSKTKLLLVLPEA